MKNTTIDHFDHIVKEKDSVKLSRVEHNQDLLKDGDALEKNNFKINSQFVDPDNNCDFCTQVNYTIGKAQFAAVAYHTEKIDLTGSNRVVFFARGQNGGEKIFVLIAGREDDQNRNAVPEKFYKDLFTNTNFEISSGNITLFKDWRKYEISLNEVNLKDITLPFGFVAIGNKSKPNQAFYIKGITFDNKTSVNPI